MEEKNINFDINAKLKSMVDVAKHIVKNHKPNDNCEPIEEVCLAYDVLNYLPKLQQEKQELIEWLEEEIKVATKKGLYEYYEGAEIDVLYIKLFALKEVLNKIKGSDGNE